MIMAVNEQDGAQQASLLDEGLARLGLIIDMAGRRLLLEYIRLLQKWNAVYNLTAIRDPKQILLQHVLDSLAILPALDAAGGGTVLDVGSGGGLPGVLIAIARPAWSVTVNDVVQKKTAFLTQVKASLALSNLYVINGRVEALRFGDERDLGFNIVISRAFAELCDFVRLAGPRVAVGGRLCAMKGVFPQNEVERLPANARLEKSVRLEVPGLAAQRHLLILDVHG